MPPPRQGKLVLRSIRTGPPQRILLSFAVVILTGALLLMLPQANTGTSPGFLRALFTATSATCVTGLVLFDTGTFWSLFGQIVILVLIQVGGLGYMVLTTILMASFRNRHLGVRQTGDFCESTPLPSHRDPRSFAKSIAVIVLVSEGLGAFILSVRFARDMSLGRAVWNGVFTSISAFCNAGFEVVSRGMTSLETYASDMTVNLVVPLLIILGGLGFVVIDEVAHHFMRPVHKHLSTHVRIVLLLTAILVFGGAATIYLLERTNPSTFRPLPLRTRLLASWFQSVTARTAGFDSIPMAALRPSTLMVIIAFMFIGASPGGTGGGVKTTTFAVVLGFVWSALTESEQVHLGRRGIRMDSVKKGIVVFTLSLGIVAMATFLLAIMDGHRFSTLNLLFEATSAFGTVGLSTGLTPSLSPGSQIVLIATMLAGRVGVLTAMLTFVAPVQSRIEHHIRFAEDDVVIG